MDVQTTHCSNGNGGKRDWGPSPASVLICAVTKTVLSGFPYVDQRLKWSVKTKVKVVSSGKEDKGWGH